MARFAQELPRLWLIALFVLVTCLLRSAFGQGFNPAYVYGAAPFQTHLQGQENVNLVNGNLHFQIPLVHLPGRDGHDFIYTMSYNSQIWWANDYTDGIGQLHNFWQ